MEMKICAAFKLVSFTVISIIASKSEKSWIVLATTNVCKVEVHGQQEHAVGNDGAGRAQRIGKQIDERNQAAGGDSRYKRDVEYLKCHAAF
ncbi:MAG: hypothetical protein LBL83_05165 [Clostridiales bacterium]|jgi:hypothetical protein|nr:hypothetical protein [Clostridiales bacterium]